MDITKDGNNWKSHVNNVEPPSSFSPRACEINKHIYVYEQINNVRKQDSVTLLLVWFEVIIGGPYWQLNLYIFFKDFSYKSHI